MGILTIFSALLTLVCFLLFIQCNKHH